MIILFTSFFNQIQLDTCLQQFRTQSIDLKMCRIQIYFRSIQLIDSIMILTYYFILIVTLIDQLSFDIS